MMHLKAVVLPCAVHSAHEDTLTSPHCVCLDQFLATLRLTFFLYNIFMCVCMHVLMHVYICHLSLK